MSATTTSTTEGTSPVVASPAATPTPAAATITAADIAALVSDPLAFEKAVSESGLNAAEIDKILNTPSAKPGNYEGKVPEVGNLKPPVAAPLVDPTKPADAPSAAPVAAEPAKPAEGEDPQPEKLGKFRVSARDFKEAEFLRLSKTLPVTEAYAKVYGAAPATEPAKPAEAAPAAAAPVEPPALTEAKASLTKLEADLAKATEDADVAQVAKIMREISKAERAVERIEAETSAAAKAAERAKQDEATTNFRQRESAATKEIISAFPKLGDPASPERAEFQQFINLKYDDPDYGAIFASPLWPKVLGREFAEAKGWDKAAAPVLPASTPAPTPGAAPAPRVTAAEVLTPGATQGGANITAETFVQDLSKMSLKDLDALLAASAR